jgi:hypothetical protein
MHSKITQKALNDTVLKWTPISQVAFKNLSDESEEATTLSVHKPTFMNPRHVKTIQF